MSEFPANKLEILKRKDAYPSEWVNSYEKFEYQTLPKKKQSTHHQKMVKGIKAMEIFLMSNIYT